MAQATPEIRIRDVMNEGSADVTFLVSGGTETVRAHGAVLARFSTKLANLSMQSVVKYPSFSKAALKNFFEHLYTDLARPPPPEDAEDLLPIAIEFGVEPLQSMCEEAISIDQDNVDRLLALSNQSRCKTLQKRCYHFKAESDIVFSEHDTPRDAYWPRRSSEGLRPKRPRGCPKHHRICHRRCGSRAHSLGSLRPTGLDAH